MTERVLRALIDRLETPRLLVPEGWSCWKLPLAPTSLDKEIEYLVQSTRSPRITREQVGSIPCPYYYVRQVLERIRSEAELSARRADQAFDNRDRLRPTIVKVDEELNRAMEALKRACELLGVPDYEATLTGGDTREHVAEIGNIHDLASSVSMARLYTNEGLIQTKLLNRKGRRPKFEKRAVLAHLGQAYLQLTGVRPKAGDGPFPRFAAAAFDQLYPGSEINDLNKLIRTLDWAAFKDNSED